MEQKNHGADYRESLEILSRVHPDPGTSCLRTAPLPAADSGAMLDIIIPAYNVEKYIGKCLRSVRKQKTRYPFRMILVDDGARDRTGEYLDRYRDAENAVVIHQKNAGQAGARNTGLLHTSSKYVMFLDSDDNLPENAVERMVSESEEKEADITAGSYCNYKVFDFLHRSYRQKEGELASSLDMFGHPWGKLYRRELFERVQFPERYWFEDSLMQQVVFPLARKMVGIGDIIYMRRINTASITQNAAGNPKSLDSVWVTLRLMDDRETLGMEKDETYYRYLLRQTKLNHLRLRALDPQVRKAAFTVMAVRIRELFPDGGWKDPQNEEIGEAVGDADYDRFAALCRS